MDLRALSMTAQVAWQDLLRLLNDAEPGTVRGTPTKRTIGGEEYWYDRYRLGDRTIERYIGPDTPEWRARLAAARPTAQDRKALGRTRSRLVGQLRQEGLLAPDLPTGQLAAALARTGAFRLGATLVGTHAFRSYEGVIGAHLGADDAAATRDIDVASIERLSLVLAEQGETVNPDLAATFKDLEFDPLPALDTNRTWRWRQTRQDTTIEFLTPSFEAEERLRDLPALGVSAQSLHFLNYLIADPIRVPLLYRQGVLVQVPRPERYAIHKLIVAARRRDGEEAGKSRKDRAQADLLIRHFAVHDPWPLVEAWRDAVERGPSWRSKIEQSLRRLPEAHRALEAARAEVEE